MKTPEEMAEMRHQFGLGIWFQTVWDGQKEYNALIRSIQTEHESNWAAVYALGLVGKLDGLLSAIGWKRYRKTLSKPQLKQNIGRELADMTKYILSLWQHFDFTELEMLRCLVERDAELTMELRKEYFPPVNKEVVVFDLDGTVADFRRGFSDWWGRTDIVKTLHVDVDNDVPFAEYEKAKAKFEEEGGYARLPAYPDAVALLRNARQAGMFLLCTTARPVDKYTNVREDSLDWLRKQGIYPDAIVFGRDERIIELLKFSGRNKIVLLEDDPLLAARAARSGFFVMLRKQPYNREMLEHPLILRFEEFISFIPWNLFQDRKAAEGMK